ncbi:hypothetical protein C8R45DRAFT_1104969 [Mycena sanguinolenta]|nr:hypothetical protein C8R45DRAFT_1104969 [Mycena sanguinolenta]
MPLFGGPRRVERARERIAVTPFFLASSFSQLTLPQLTSSLASSQVSPSSQCAQGCANDAVMQVGWALCAIVVAHSMFDDGRATWALYCGDLGGFAGDVGDLAGSVDSQFHPARQLNLSIADHGIVVVPPLSRTSSTSGSVSSVSASVTTLPTIGSSGAAPSSTSWTGAGSRPGIAVALALGRGSCRDLGVVVVTVESLVARPATSAAVCYPIISKLVFVWVAPDLSTRSFRNSGSIIVPFRSFASDIINRLANSSSSSSNTFLAPTDRDVLVLVSTSHSFHGARDLEILCVRVRVRVASWARLEFIPFRFVSLSALAG